MITGRRSWPFVLGGALLVTTGLATPALGQTFHRGPGVRLHAGTYRYRIDPHFSHTPWHARPRPGGLRYTDAPRERLATSGGRRGSLSLYPGPASTPYRGRLRNDYRTHPRFSRWRWAPAITPPPYGVTPPPARPEAVPPPQPTPAPAPAVTPPARRTAPPPIIIEVPKSPRTPAEWGDTTVRRRPGDTGWTLLARGETVRALGRFAARVAIDGTDAPARVGYALAAAVYEDDATATEALRAALAVDPDALDHVAVDEDLAPRLRAVLARLADGTREEAVYVRTALTTILGDAADGPTVVAGR
jgi:hypothetical protein